MGAYVWPVDNWQAGDGSKYTGRRLRQLIGALVTGKTTARPLGSRSGVFPGPDPASLVTATPTECTVNPHTGVIDAQPLAVAGPYFYSLDDARALPVPAADGSQARVDLVVMQVSDPAEADGTSEPGVEPVYVPGAPGGGSPATPDRSLALAWVNVPKLGDGDPTVTWLARAVVAAGGIVPVATLSHYPASPYVGQYIDDASLGLLRWNGSKWAPYGVGGDTGWQTMTNLTTGWAQDSTPAQARCIGKRVQLVGGLVNATFNSGSYTTVCKIPSSVPPPPGTRVVPLAAGSTALRSARLLVDGSIQVATSAASSLAFRFDNIDYLID